MQNTITFLGKKIQLLKQDGYKNVLQALKEIRNISDEDATFHRPSYDDLHDPFLMRDMDKAVARIQQARETWERVMIFGDYDADGVSSTAALFLYLKQDLGLNVSYRIPDRLKDGYGMKTYFIDDIATAGAGLIITVDCGIRDHDVIAYAREKNIDVIVTDHHTPGETLPSGTIATINPHRSDCPYPYKYLSGSGVVLKLIHALSADIATVKKYIDICTVGTIADVMPLTGENRIIAALGLKKMQRSEHTCFEELTPKLCHLDADFVGFQMGPLINAAGRMDSPLKALNMFLSAGETSRQYIRELQSLNELRKTKTNMYFEQVMQALDHEKDLLTYVGDIPHGIIGLVAGKVCERYNKPVMILAREEEHFVGSCRAPAYYNIVDLLSDFSDQFVSFWWHDQAAGFTIERGAWETLEPLLQAKTTATVDTLDTTPVVMVDLVLDHKDIHLETLGGLRSLQPYGNGNIKPIFMLENLTIESVQPLGKDQAHLKMQTHMGEVVAWGWGEHVSALKSQKTLSIIGELGSNEWRWEEKLQIRMVDCIL